MLSCLLKSHWTDIHVSKICLSPRLWPTCVFQAAACVRHLNETGSSLISRSFPWAQHTLWNSSSEEKFICLFSELHMGSLNRQLPNPHSTRGRTQINLLWSELQQTVLFFCPRFQALSTLMEMEFLFVPDCDDMGYSPWKRVLPFLLVLSSWVLAKRRTHSVREGQTFGSEQEWLPTDKDFQCIYWFYTEASQIYSKNARRLAFSFPSFRVLQIREHLCFCCCVSDQVSCSQVHRGSSSRSCSSLGHVMLPAGWSLVLASGGYGCIPPLACTVWPELWWWCLETLSR